MKIKDLTESKEIDDLKNRLDQQLEAYFRVNWDWDLPVEDQSVSLDSYMTHWYPSIVGSDVPVRQRGMDRWVKNWEKENNKIKPHRLQYIIRQRYLHWFNEYAGETY